MLKKVLLVGAALATLGVPAAANAQYYGRSSGSYGHGRHYYWDGRHYRDRDNNAVLDAVIGGLLGYAVGSMSNRSYGYSYPSYGYGYNNAYYGNPGYGYSYQYGYPAYGYSNNYYYGPRRW
ncbi:MAG TPA: hypothetical protein VGU01_14825 [Sphingomicrobium sp.]|nr:hypothetical protein [Sphingomicrobium sp.]